uniref:Uncharacterized protein n=1 Tax=Arundo donax TaxID=35708 RepID=A0A0A9HKE9_ARUDO
MVDIGQDHQVPSYLTSVCLSLLANTVQQ